MKIELNREMKIELLRWLRLGVVDTTRIEGWGKETAESLSDEELQAQLNELDRRMYPETCERLKSAGLCVECNKHRRKTKPVTK